MAIKLYIDVRCRLMNPKPHPNTYLSKVGMRLGGGPLGGGGKPGYKQTNK